ncbi:ATP-binding protein [Cellulomonas sp. NPDC089187]|uniref:sensor histidine kinase n=1 Tax=Cellulomonas sp. NPDC089187 TaxID=3154970 RepID=UPI003431ABD0
MRLGPQDADRADRWALLFTTGSVMAVFSVGAAAQTAYVYSALAEGAGVPVGARIAANLGAVVAMLALLGWRGTELPARGSWRLVTWVMAAGLLAGLCRAGLQVLFGVYDADHLRALAIDLMSAAAVAWIASAIGFTTMRGRRRLRAQIEHAARGQVQIELALAALQHEEVRVRREVAEGLHGSVQQRLVLAVARLDRLAERLGRGSVEPADLDMLAELRAELETVREADIRATSRMLYPDQLEVGMVPAIRALLARIPTSVNTRLGVAPEVRTLDDPAAPQLSQGERLLAVRVVEEAVSNALRHGRAELIEVRLSRDAGAVQVSVWDDGVGFGDRPGPASGTARLADRLRLAGGELRLSSVPGDGTQVVARVPVESLRLNG